MENEKNTLRKSLILSCQTDFALIYTDFVRLGCYFTWSTTYTKYCFWILLANPQKCLKAPLTLMGVIAPSTQFSRPSVCPPPSPHQCERKSLNNFWRFANEIQKILSVCGTSCKITAPTDKICGNESKICMTSQNYRFVESIFPIFQILIPCGTCHCA